MKKLGLLVVTVLFVTGVSSTFGSNVGHLSQKTEFQIQKPIKGQKMDAEKMAQKQTQKLVEELKLTKGQESKVLEINQEFMKKQADIRSKMSSASDAEKEPLKKEMKKNNQEKNKQIKALLTEDQVKLYSEMQKKR